jgi:hypothetical protein
VDADGQILRDYPFSKQTTHADVKTSLEEQVHCKKTFSRIQMSSYFSGYVTGISPLCFRKILSGLYAVFSHLYRWETCSGEMRGTIPKQSNLQLACRQRNLGVLKGTVLQDRFRFWWYAWSVQGLKRERGQFLNFVRCSNGFILQKMYFSRLMRVCVGFIMLVA